MAIDRKEQIYSTARSLFSVRGYPATTVRDIAREMNIQAGSLYAHIESKEDVLWEIVEQAAEQFLSAVEPIAASEIAAPDKLRAMIRAHVQVVSANLANATVYLHDWKYLGEARRALVKEQRDHYEHLYRQVIEDGIRAGHFAAGDPKIAALTVLSAVNWLPQWYNPEGPLSPAQVADSFSDVILRGLEAREQASTNEPLNKTTNRF